jgi:SnoaL-like domain
LPGTYAISRIPRLRTPLKLGAHNPLALADERLASQQNRSDAMTQTHSVSVAELKRAIEGRDAKALAAFYADDAVLRIIDRDNPPSQPREIKGREAIASYYDDVCGRAMTHHVESGVANGQALAFTQACSYPDGTKVFCAAMLQLEDGRIVRQTAVQAWD